MREEIKNLVPKEKSDTANIDKLMKLSDEEIECIIPELLEWLQDMNWPVADAVIEVLVNHKSVVEKHLLNLLKPDNGDEIWKLNVIRYVLGKWKNQSGITIDKDILSEIERIVEHPTDGEVLEEVDLVACELLDREFFECRRATVDDVEVLVEYRKLQLIDEGSKPQGNIDDELRRFFMDGIKDGSVVIYVTEDDEKIIGTAGVCYYNYPPTFSNPTGKMAYVTDVYVKPEYRLKGIATKLMVYIMRNIKLSKCAFARLHASIHGKKMYEGIGFTDAQGFMIKKID